VQCDKNQHRNDVANRACDGESGARGRLTAYHCAGSERVKCHSEPADCFQYPMSSAKGSCPPAGMDYFGVARLSGQS